MELQQRIGEEGFEIAFNPPGDGTYFFVFFLTLKP